MVSRRHVEEAIASCTACHLATPLVAPVPFRGPTPAVAAVIGEAPGRTENREGRPLIGPAGKLLDETLTSFGMDLTAICYFNVVSCFPMMTVGRKPTAESIEACSPLLKAQLSLADPKFVLLLGNYALQAFHPGARIMSSRGTWWEDEGTSFLPTVHPAGVLRNEAWKPLFQADIEDFVRKVCHACHPSDRGGG